VGFNLEVSRVIKGDQTLVGTIIPVDWTWRNADLPTLTAAGSPPTITGYGLWFLRSSPTGWALLPWLPPIGLFIPELAGPIISVYNYSPSASLADKIASEVSNAIEGANGAHIPELAVLHDGLLEELKSPAIQTLYQRLSISPSAAQQELGSAD
jgi:hypothetical protein